MRRAGGLGAVLAALAAGAGCGDSHAPPDAPGACWPLTANGGGTVELGTGQLVFEPMPDLVPIVRDSAQAAYPFVEIMARIHGIPPGENPQNTLDPSHPKTMVTGTVDGFAQTFGLHCPANKGYVPAAVAGAYDLAEDVPLAFSGVAISDLAGKQCHIVLDVVGRNGVSGHVEKVVTLYDGTGSGTIDAGVAPAK